MPLIPLDQVKARFPTYDLFLKDPEADLPGRVEEAERELARYVRAPRRRSPSGWARS